MKTILNIFSELEHTKSSFNTFHILTILSLILMSALVYASRFIQFKETVKVNRILPM